MHDIIRVNMGYGNSAPSSPDSPTNRWLGDDDDNDSIVSSPQGSPLFMQSRRTTPMVIIPRNPSLLEELRSVSQEVQHEEHASGVLPTIEEMDTITVNDTNAMVDDFEALGVAIDEDSSSEYNPEDHVMATDDDFEEYHSPTPSDVVMNETIGVVPDEDPGREQNPEANSHQGSADSRSTSADSETAPGNTDLAFLLKEYLWQSCDCLEGKFCSAGNALMFLLLACFDPRTNYTHGSLRHSK